MELFRAFILVAVVLTVGSSFAKEAKTYQEEINNVR